MSYNSKNSSGIGFLVLIVLLLVCFIAYGLVLRGTGRVETITIKERERITGSDSGYYLVFTEPNEAGISEFKVDDSVMLWTFDSSTRYNRLEPGNTYRVRVYGWRANWPTMYPNITEVLGTVAD